MRKFLKSSLLHLFLFSIFSSQAYAQNNSFVTIVNPQRISTYTKDYMGSFREEWSQIRRKNLPATWPVTYDVLLKKDFVEDLKTLDKNQELGIFLEITPNFAQEAGVTYNKTASWHYATSLFLSGYSQIDRKKLIDTVFHKFKDTFGYYPKSVGGWWVDSYSLSYMQKTYGITGVLGVSDQYDLDSYQVWGTWWSVPYYPSIINAALPAQSTANKINVVTFRWASRDPLNGYKSPSEKAASLYSLQDYGSFPHPASYFQDLLQTYAVQQNGNAFGQATVGLEGDLSVSTYQGQFADQLTIVKSLEDQGKIQATTMNEFSQWYIKRFPNLSPDHMIVANDLLGNQNKTAIWKQTPFYRVGLVTDNNTNKTSVIDLRSYPANFEEPYYAFPNKQLNLSINLPYKIDSIIDPSTFTQLELGSLKNITNAILTFEKGSVRFETKKIVFPKKAVVLGENFPVSKNGILYKDYALTIPFTLKRRLPFLPNQIPFFIPQTYYISQTEYDALTVLKRLKTGKILAYDKDCLKCVFTGQYKPAAAAGHKSYISKYSGKVVDTDHSFLLAKSSVEARSILKDKNIRYIYLTHYADYIESLPYLPTDLGLTRVYQNGNAEIWKVN